jgi:hypothetical protein
MQILDGIQGEPWWHEHRAGIPTVSEFFRFITAARGDYSKQAIGYIADLIVESREGPGEFLSTYWMDRGVTLESEAISEYEFNQDVEVETIGLILNRGAGWSPDGRVAPKGAVEAKCPKASTHVKWLIEDKLPDEHKVQCHGALVVGELDWIDWMSYCPGYPTLIKRVVPTDYTRKVEAALAKFIKDYEDAKRKLNGAAA